MQKVLAKKYWYRYCQYFSAAVLVILLKVLLTTLCLLSISLFLHKCAFVYRAVRWSEADWWWISTVVDHCTDSGVIVSNRCLTGRNSDTLQTSYHFHCRSCHEAFSLCEARVRRQRSMEFAKSSASSLDLESSAAQFATSVRHCHQRANGKCSGWMWENSCRCTDFHGLSHFFWFLVLIGLVLVHYASATVEKRRQKHSVIRSVCL